MEVLSLLASSQDSKAASRLSSNGVASMRDEHIKQQMLSNYPQRNRDIPVRVVKGKTVENLNGLRERFKSMSKRRGKAPGTGGMRAEFIQVLGEMLGEEHMRLFETFGLRYLHGELQPWFYVVWLTVQTVPLLK